MRAGNGNLGQGPRASEGGREEAGKGGGRKAEAGKGWRGWKWRETVRDAMGGGTALGGWTVGPGRER